MNNNLDELEGRMFDGIIVLCFLKRMNISMRRSNKSDARRVTHRMGGEVCHAPGISVPWNATPILVGCRLLDWTSFLVRIREQVASSVKAWHILRAFSIWEMMLFP